jgi:hypothetical protein
MNPPDALKNDLHLDGCPTCGRLSCQRNARYRERDLAWGAFDAAKKVKFDPALRDAAFASTDAVNAAEKDCDAHVVDWRRLYFAAIEGIATSSAKEKQDASGDPAPDTEDSRCSARWRPGILDSDIASGARCALKKGHAGEHRYRKAKTS